MASRIRRETRYLGVAETVAVDIKMTVGTIAENVTVVGMSPLIETTTVSVGQVMAERTVQEIPLNGRHFVDLGPLMPGGVTPPQNAALSAPLRGQGSFSFFSAGNRETAVNFMINGINLNDLSNSQVTFQPSINTVSEFKVDNSTFSAEYGRNSGAIVNVATRSGANTLHGEGFDFYRDDSLDSRNYFNPEPNPKSPFNRKQFGVNIGGPIKKNKTFYFFSYEGLRHTQGVDLNAGVLTDAQRAGVTDPVAKNLLQYIPLGNTTDANGQARLLASGTAPVTIDQYTLDMRHSLSQNDTLHGYYAFQRDLRKEPNAQGNTVPGFGDSRGGHRQVMTVNETHVFTQALVNEARVGYNRINISFNPSVVVNPADVGISDGINFPIGLPQITITSLGLNFGGPANFPQGRTVVTTAASDTATYLRGNHVIKFGGEFRRASVLSFTDDPGTFTYASPTTFQTGVGTGFNITLGDRSADLIIPAVGAFVQDSIAIGANLKLDAGLRYDFIGSPTEPDNKLVVFDASKDALVRLGAGIDQIHKNGSDFQPRLGAIWSPDAGGIVVRGAYAVMVNQTNTGYVGGSACESAAGDAVERCRRGEARHRICHRAGGGACADDDESEFPAWTHADLERQRRKGYSGKRRDGRLLRFLRRPSADSSQHQPVRQRCPPLSDAVADEPHLAWRDTGQHHRGPKYGLVPLQGPLADGESSHVQRSATQLVLHVVEIDRYEFVRRHRRHGERIAPKQLRSGRQRGAVRLRRSPSIQPERHVRVTVSRQSTDGRLAGDRRPAASIRESSQHHHEHQYIHRCRVAAARPGR